MHAHWAVRLVQLDTSAAHGRATPAARDRKPAEVAGWMIAQHLSARLALGIDPANFKAFGVGIEPGRMCAANPMPFTLPQAPVVGHQFHPWVGGNAGRPYTWGLPAERQPIRQHLQSQSYLASAA
jgi:hypothetical protein